MAVSDGGPDCPLNRSLGVWVCRVMVILRKFAPLFLSSQSRRLRLPVETFGGVCLWIS